MRLQSFLFALFSLCLFALMKGSISAWIEYSMNGNEMAASHIVLVPFVSVALIYMNRRKIFENVRFSMLPGAMIAVVGFGLLGAGWTWGDSLGELDRLSLVIASIVVVWLGIFLFFFGASSFKQGLFPLLFLALCIPIPSAILQGSVTVLQYASAETAFVLMKMTGTPIYRDGFVFVMPSLVIEVAPECSGIRSGIGMFIVSLLAGYFFLQSWWKRSALLIAAVVIGIFKNAIRIDTLSLLTIHVDPGIIEGRLHHDGGIFFFAIGLSLLYPILMMLARLEKPGNLQPRIVR